MTSSDQFPAPVRSAVESIFNCFIFIFQDMCDFELLED